jgi:anaerobic ribonucleoside-triphosphate reductase activating protein
MWDFVKQFDVVVDGPFIEELRDITLPFRGSSNQRIINKDDLNLIC